MIARASRTLLRRLGIRVPFPGVICPELRKTIAIESDWRARVTTRRSLVFTEDPRPGDLSDHFAIEPGTPFETLFYDSPDAMEVQRRLSNKRTLEIGWVPKAPVTRYAFYEHQDSWIHPASHRGSAIAAHYRCDMKTGMFEIEITTPGFFEAGVMFRLPRWRTLRTERALVRHALTALNAPDAATPAFDGAAGGRHASWRIVGPRRGERFVFVLFHEHGVVEWERRLKETSFAGRLRARVSQLTHAFRT